MRHWAHTEQLYYIYDIVGEGLQPHMFNHVQYFFTINMYKSSFIADAGNTSKERKRKRKSVTVRIPRYTAQN